MTSRRKALLFVHCCIGIAVFWAADASAQGAAGDAKVDICHIPPGNPDNPNTITISANAVSAHLAHGDSIGPCESEPVAEVRESAASSACTCPRSGVWRVTNLDGYMECKALGVRRTLTGADKNDGAIWILNDDCSTIFSEAYEKGSADVIMDRGRECLYFGTAPGEEDGAKVIFDGAYKLENPESITGEYYMAMSGSGLECSGYRPFEINFVEPLNEKNYAKLEKDMQKQLAEARDALDENREQIDKYLEETDGGKAFGGRNGQQ